jgi:hypothetical protein
VFEAGHVLEELLYVAAFPSKLGLVVEMLILTAAAAGKERTARGGALGGGDEDGDEVGLGVVLVVAEDAHADLFTGKSKRNHEHPAGFGVVRQRDAGQPGAEIRERGDLDLKLVMIRERMGVEGVFAGHEGHETHEMGRNEVWFSGWRIGTVETPRGWGA